MLNLKVNYTQRDVKVLTDQLVAAVDRLVAKMPQTGTVTLATGVALTVVSNSRVTPQSVVVLSPAHSNAQGVPYSYESGSGAFTVFHDVSATADRTFGYVIF